MRAPLRVLNDLAARFRDRTIAEIGTRNGDGMQCFSQVASTALAISGVTTVLCSILGPVLGELRVDGIEPNTAHGAVYVLFPLLLGLHALAL